MATTGEVPTTTRQQWGIPDWLSPARLIAACAVSPMSVAVPAGQVTEILKPSARRVGLLVIVPDGAKAGFFLSPLKNPDVAGITLSGSSNYFLATLSDWLVFVPGSWWAYHVGGTTLQVGEVIRN